MTVIIVNNTAYKKMVKAIKQSGPDIVIPVIRYKPVTDIMVGEIVRVRPNYYEKGLTSMDAEVVDIKEFDPRKDVIPEEEIGRYYVGIRLHKLPRVFVIYLRPVSF
jgi:hypothetical protein